MPTSVPPQVGATGLLVQGAARFTGYIVQAGTWTVKDALKVVITRDGNSNVYNYTGYSPGEEDGCTWTIIKGSAPAAAMTPITENLSLWFPANPVANNTLQVGPTQIYTFKAAVADANDVLIGATLGATLLNLINAIMAVEGAGVGAGTVANTCATAMLDPLVLNAVLLAQITPWTTATPLEVEGTCGAKVNFMPITSLIFARTFMVQEGPETDHFGGEPVQQKVKLNYHADGFVPQVVS